MQNVGTNLIVSGFLINCRTYDKPSVQLERLIKAVDTLWVSVLAKLAIKSQSNPVIDFDQRRPGKKSAILLERKE